MIHRRTRKSYDTPGDAHFLTFSVAGRRPYLSEPRAAEAFLEELDKARLRLEFDIWAYVVMPEHVHTIIWPRKEIYSMAAILESVKQQSASRILREGHPTQGTFWLTGGGYDRNVFSSQEAWKHIGYIHRNPVKRLLCESAFEWPYSSAGAYAEEPLPCFIPVDLCPWR